MIETGGMWEESLFQLDLFVGILPVFLFLLVLVFLDSFKLVRLPQVLRSIAVGCLVAFVCVGINRMGYALAGPHRRLYSGLAVPALEEILKAAYLYWLIRSNRVGFMVDAAIHGFAIGAGFSLIENLYYLRVLADSHLLIWVLRGFGTAIMHGGTTAIVGILAARTARSREGGVPRRFLPGLAVAFTVHSLYNFSLLTPPVSAALIVILVPLVITYMFHRSERSLYSWLMEGFDADVEMLQTITGGSLSDTHAGKYLEELKNAFPAEAIADMFCLLQVSLELAVRAKGVLLMREAGFDSPADPEVKARFEELAYLEKSIGRTGKLALAPLLAGSSRDIWQLRLLGYR